MYKNIELEIPENTVIELIVGKKKYIRHLEKSHGVIPTFMERVFTGMPYYVAVIETGNGLLVSVGVTKSASAGDKLDAIELATKYCLEEAGMVGSGIDGPLSRHIAGTLL